MLMSSEREANYVRLMSTYDRSVRRLAMAYERDHALREDLIQEIWLALWLALPSFRGDCAERTFVYRIAHNRGVSHIQQARRGRAETLDEQHRFRIRPQTQSLPPASTSVASNCRPPYSGCRWGFARLWFSHSRGSAIGKPARCSG